MCGQKPAKVTYQNNGKTQMIAKKEVDTISKWTKGALARRRFKKLVITKNIQGKSPTPKHFLSSSYPSFFHFTQSSNTPSMTEAN